MELDKIFIGTKPEPTTKIPCSQCQGKGCTGCDGRGDVLLVNKHEATKMIAEYNKNPFFIFFSKNIETAKKVAKDINLINFSTIGEPFVKGEDY